MDVGPSQSAHQQLTVDTGSACLKRTIGADLLLVFLKRPRLTARNAKKTACRLGLKLKIQCITLVLCSN
jgi:hypothetical protein